jgi:hypothetical protein
LLTRIKHRKREGLTGVKIAYSFIKRQIQPLQERSELGYKYKGAEDPSRLKKEDLTHDEILERLQIFFGPVNFKGKIPREYSAEYLPVCPLTYCCLLCLILPIWFFMLIPRFSFVGTHRFVLLPSPLARAFDR